MNFSIIPTDKFKREAKRLIKKFPSLKQQLAELSKTLAREPESGIALGNKTYKIRLKITSKGKGKSKSGGARIITCVMSDNKEIYLLTIYDKSEFDSIDVKILKTIIDSLHLDI